VSMGEFLAELYLSHADAGGARKAVARVRSAAEELAQEGRAARLVRTTFVPGDETCFVAFEADAPDTVVEVGRRAGLEFERVVPAVEAI
jgi:hypothetical protein